jgi:hypothetical protein
MSTEKKGHFGRNCILFALFLTVFLLGLDSLARFIWGIYQQWFLFWWACAAIIVFIYIEYENIGKFISILDKKLGKLFRFE